MDALFLISSAIVSQAGKSIYSTEERFQQTLETVNSIDKYCPNSFKILFDASATKPDERYFKELSDKNVIVLYCGDNEAIQQYSKYGVKNVTEMISFFMALDWLQDNLPPVKRIYKISGRYRLNEHFVPGYEHVGKYVFTVPTRTWMSPERIKETGVEFVYQSRLFHFDSELLKDFVLEASNTFDDCLRLGIDIEHGYYKNFKKYDPVEMPVIGLCGNLAPNGEYINE